MLQKLPKVMFIAFYNEVWPLSSWGDPLAYNFEGPYVLQFNLYQIAVIQFHCPYRQCPLHENKASDAKLE